MGGAIIWPYDERSTQKQTCPYRRGTGMSSDNYGE